MSRGDPKLVKPSQLEDAMTTAFTKQGIDELKARELAAEKAAATRRGFRLAVMGAILIVIAAALVVFVLPKFKGETVASVGILLFAAFIGFPGVMWAIAGGSEMSNEGMKIAAKDVKGFWGVVGRGISKFKGGSS